MNKLKGLITSNTDDWATPQDFYDELDREFHFDLDPCSSDSNHKASKYFTKKQNGLEQSWKGHNVFMNPPYGKTIGLWCEKAYKEKNNAKVIVGLLPSRTDTRWFHDFIYNKAEIRFIKGRLKFGGSKNYAPFPSMVVIWR